jgi:hypothetical protein
MKYDDIADIAKYGKTPAKKFYFTASVRARDGPCLASRTLPGTPRHVPFTWENVRLFASREQKAAFNRFRIAYIDALITRYCARHGCGPDVVGSPPTSAMSNADFNITGDTTTTSSTKRGDAPIVAAIRGIERHHARNFADGLDVVFDVNLYGTSDTIFDGVRKLRPKALQFSQRVWASMRIHEFLTPDEAAAALSQADRKVYAACGARAASEKREERREGYLGHLNDYFAARDVETPERLADLFSTAKFHERETYRSIGAYLHIVRRKPVAEMDLSLRLDSAYDNFGFVLETMRGDRCSSVAYRVARASKYVSRMCAALLSPRSRTAAATLKNVCDALNERRKTHAITAADVAPLLRLLGVADASAFPLAVYGALLNNKQSSNHSHIGSSSS